MVGGVVEVVIDLKLIRKGGAEFRNSTGGGVLGFSCEKRGDGCVLDELRRIDFRFATGECVDFFAIGDHCLSLRRDGESERGRNLGDTG